MIFINLNLIFLVTLVVTPQLAHSVRPKPSGNFGILLPNISGWGWNQSTTTTTTPPPETTTETTTPSTAAPTASPGWNYPGVPSGWSNAPGWTQSVSGEIDLVAEAALVGQGEAETAHSSQTVVNGDSSNPAVVNIQTGSYTSIGQGSGILQTSSANSLGDSSSFQGVDGYNTGDSGEYYGGSLSGNNVNTVSGGASYVGGDGAVAQAAASQDVPLVQNGWRK